MTKWSMLALLGLGLAGAAQAAPSHSCIQPGRGMSQVVATVSNPADCCTGRMQCPQFLSTTVVVRPLHPERT